MPFPSSVNVFHQESHSLPPHSTPLLWPLSHHCPFGQLFLLYPFDLYQFLLVISDGSTVPRMCPNLLNTSTHRQSIWVIYHQHYIADKSMSLWITPNLSVKQTWLPLHWVCTVQPSQKELCFSKNPLFSHFSCLPSWNNRYSNPGGTDAGVILAWEIALNYTNAFNELLDFDILGTFSSGFSVICCDTDIR